MLCITKAGGKITFEVANKALNKLGVDKFGLDIMDRNILGVLIDKFSGGPVGIKSLGVAIGEDPYTIEDVYEPYLIKQGFMQRTLKHPVENFRHLMVILREFTKPVVLLMLINGIA